MSKPNMAKAFKGIRSTVVKHSPEILVGIGISGLFATTVLAVRATPKALELIEKASQEKEVPVEELTPIEKTKACWKCYIPAAVTGVLSAGCIIGAQSVNARRNAALAAAYTLSDTALREYQAKVTEVIGEKKDQLIRDKMSEDKIKNNPVSKNEVIITTKGDTLCYDELSGRYFKSDIDKIKRAVNEINRQINLDMYASLNDFYDELDLDHTQIGYDLGWNLDSGLVDVYFSSQLADDGTPCIVMNHRVAPKYGYSNFM